MQFLIDTFFNYTIWSLILGILMLVMLFFSKKNLLKFILILATPTTAIGKLKDGKSEIKGIIKAIKTVPDINKKAVYHECIEEYYTSGDDGGWSETGREVVALPFNVVDKTGTVLIYPKDAFIDFTKKSKEVLMIDSKNRTRNSYLLDGEEVYILGDYQNNAEGKFIGKKEENQFLISNQTEGKLLVKYGFKGSILLIITFFIISISLSFAKDTYLETWEGEVISKWVDDYEDSEGDDVYTYMIELDNGLTKDIGRDRYSEVKVKDYVAKFKGKYKFEVMAGGTKKIVEAKKKVEGTDTTKTDTTKVEEEKKTP